MEGGTLLVDAKLTKESMVQPMKYRKRKLSTVIGFSESLHKLKKKKKSNCLLLSEDYAHVDFKFLKFQNSSDYLAVVARPENFLSAPQIFQTTRLNVSQCNASDFLCKILSTKCFNTKVSERFKQLSFITHSFDDKKKDNCVKINNLKNNVEQEKKIIKMKVRRQESVACENKNINEQNVEIDNQVDIYRVIQRKSLIFHMHHPCKFSFHGEIKATIILGEIEILGYTLGQSSSRKSVDLYSPNFCTPLIVETKASAKLIQPKEDVQSKLKDFLTEEDCKTLLSKLKLTDSILLVEQIVSNFGVVLNKYFDKVLFPKDLEDVSSMTETMKSLQSIFTFKLSKDGKYFRKNQQWEKIPLGHCTVLCGGKGVGKSTLLRYYVNKLLAVGEKVVVLDFDPGQPEFTYPGCVSAVVVEEPVIGPNFTHVLDPVVMTFFGDVDVSKNPTKYLDCVSYVIENCKQREELLKMKWLVNTMGFCKGLGIELIITVLKLVNPSTVVQIKGSDLKNNYPFYLTAVALNAKSGFASTPTEDLQLSHELRVVKSSAERDKKQLQGGLKRKQLRDIMSISYFCKMVSPPFYNLNAVQPYIIPFSKIYLAVNFLVHPNDVIKAFNANVVSLSHFDPDGEEILTSAVDEDYFQIVVKPHVIPSLGIGFVRGIDCKNKKFYVLSHLKTDILGKVNCLSLGRVGPPRSMFLRQEGMKGRIAYTSTCAASTVKNVRRMFRVPGTPSSKEKVP